MSMHANLSRRFLLSLLSLLSLLPLVLAVDAEASAVRVARVLSPSLATGLPSVSLLPSPYVFPNTVTGQSSATQIFTLTNASGGAFTPSSIAITGANPADFAIDSHTCAAPVANFSSCTITAHFAPTTTGNRVALLSVVYPNPANNNLPAQIDAVISGTGAAPAWSLTPTPHVFASTTLGQGSATQVFTFTNNTGSLITMNGATLIGANPGDFVIDNDTCTVALNTGGTCTVTAHFAPGAVGPRAAVLRVNFTNVLPTYAEASISGTGVAAPTVFTPVPTLGGWGLLALVLALAAAALRHARRTL